MIFPTEKIINLYQNHRCNRRLARHIRTVLDNHIHQLHDDDGGRSHFRRIHHNHRDILQICYPILDFTSVNLSRYINCALTWEV